MKKIIGFAITVISVLLLVSCRGADNGVLRENDPPQTEPRVTIETAKSSEASGITLIPETQSAPPVTEDTIPFIPMTEQTVTETEPVSEAVTEPAASEEFSFSDEFYTMMAEILERYQLNLNCDNSESCLCNPEYELLAEDGVTVIEPRERVISIYYYDIGSGFEYSLNPGAHYPVASSVKIPFCTLVYKKIDAGEIDPDTVLTYEKRHYFKGSGVIVQGDFGQEFTVSQLLNLAVTRSDNVAYEMLKDLVPWDEFSEYLEAIGCTHRQDIRKTKQKLCCESAGAYGRDLAEYLRSEGACVDSFKADLLNTRIPMIVSSYPVYRKYGWTKFSFHDIAYVDAPRPYVLAVLTNLEGDDPADYELYREISLLIEKASQKENLSE